MKKKNGGISALAPQRTKVLNPQPTPETDEVPASGSVKHLKATLPGPRGGEAIRKRTDRAISLTLKVSRSQYRRLNDARLDAHTTTQQLVIDALTYFFEHRHGTKF